MAAGLAACAAAQAETALERAEERARELCAKMTLEEKAGELMVYDYGCLGDDRWGAYTNLVNRSEIGAEDGYAVGEKRQLASGKGQFGMISFRNRSTGTVRIPSTTICCRPL